VIAHPERHVGEHAGREQVGDGLEDRLAARAVVVANGRVDDHAGPGGQQQRGTHTEEHVTEMLAPTQSVQVGEQDRDDHARLDSLTQEDHERGEHEASIWLIGSGFLGWSPQFRLGKPNIPSSPAAKPG